MIYWQVFNNGTYADLKRILSVSHLSSGTFLLLLAYIDDTECRIEKKCTQLALYLTTNLGTTNMFEAIGKKALMASGLTLPQLPGKHYTT
jgi:hypothetical protein